MEGVRGEEFLRWAAGVGIGFDPRYPDSRRLCLLPTREHARFWGLPADPAAWPHFVASLLDGLDEWASGFLWPRSGTWPESRQSQQYNEGVRDVVLRGAGVPDGWAGAVRIERDEEEALLAVLFVYMAFGWCVDDDLFFIPNHGRQLLQTDHHDVIHAVCASEGRVLKLVGDMAKACYELPTEPPDWTFKRPAWMAGAVPDAPEDRPRD
jgi:hypothetical protein